MTSVEAVKAMMAEQTRQEQALYGQPSQEQPGRGEGPPPPEFYGPPEYLDTPHPCEMTAHIKPVDQHTEDLPSIDRMDIRLCLETEPPKRGFIVDRYIPTGVVGLLIGTGATGKSILVLLILMCIASGRSIRPFTVSTARAVMLVNVEDDHQDLHFRIRRIAEEYGFSQAEKDLLAKNLIIYPARGQLGPLMELDFQKPVPTLAADWLRKQINLHLPGLVALDTKSRLFGLDENSNDHGSQWVGSLENMILPHDETSIMIVSHTSKAAATTSDHHATRGASSVGDNCRFGLSLTWLKDDEGKTWGIRDVAGHIKLTHTKASYSKQLDPVIFRKNDFSVPVMVDIDTTGQVALGFALDLLIEVLLKDHPEGINKRQLEKASEAIPKAIRAEIVELAGITKTDWPKVVALGIESARLEAFEDPLSPAKNKSVLIRVRRPETQGFADEGMTQNQLFQNVQNGMDGITGICGCPEWL